MQSDLQHIVDALAANLQRSVSIDDPSFRLRAYSRTYGPVDGSRLGSVLNLVLAPKIVDWITSLDLLSGDEPVRIPANPVLDCLARFCVPIVFEGHRLGNLFVVDPDESVAGQEIVVAKDAADAAAVVLFQERLGSELIVGQERELARDLLDNDPTVRDSAVRRLVEDEILRTGLLVVFTIEPQGEVDEETRLAIDLTLVDARRVLPRRHALHLTRLNHGLLLVVPTSDGERPTVQEWGAEILRNGYRRHRGAAAGEPIIGIGDPCASLAEAHLGYQQARAAAHVARIVPGFGSTARWSTLGVYQVLIRMPPETLRAGMLPSGLVRLLAQDSDFVLAETMECFLDLAGDVRRTAERLMLHRTSVYQRLGRIQSLAGVDLSDGGQRLTLHLGLKIARLAGLLPHNGHPQRSGVGDR